MQGGSEVQPIYVRAGMVWEDVEHRWLVRYLDAIASPLLHPARSLQFPLREVYQAHWSFGGAGLPGYTAPDEAVYLPGRNVGLVAKTAVYCALNGIERIAIGLLAGNPFPDATDAFFESFAASLSTGLGCPIRIERPFATMGKADVVRLGAHLPLELTFSCIRPVDEAHCADCAKCAERQRAFRKAGVPDPTVYYP